MFRLHKLSEMQLYRPNRHSKSTTELLTIADQKAKYPVSIAIQISGTEEWTRNRVVSDVCVKVILYMYCYIIFLILILVVILDDYSIS